MLTSLESLQTKFSHDTYSDGESKELTKRNLHEHFRIVQAIEARDPDAAEEAMRDHLKETMKFLMEYIKKKSK